MLRAKDQIYAVYQEKSFSKAAAKLYISQPALSANIKKAEEFMGRPIFNRNTNPISLTPAGEFYISRLEKVMYIEQEMEQYFRQERESHLTIGSSAFFCAHILPEIVQDFQALYPQHQISLIEADADSLKRGLEDGTMDFALEVDEMDRRHYLSRVIQLDHLLLLVPSHYTINDHLEKYRMTFEQVKSGLYLDPNAPAISMNHFKDEPFLFLKRGNDSYRRCMKICSSADFNPRIIMYLDQLLTAYYISCSGKGLAFIRASITHYVEPTDKLFFYKISDALATRNVYLHTKKKGNVSEGELKFQSYISEIVNRGHHFFQL